MQRFKLPRPVVCAGGLLRVELLGRAQMQARAHPPCGGRLSECCAPSIGASIQALDSAALATIS
jgi:hypothetical protein